MEFKYKLKELQTARHMTQEAAASSASLMPVRYSHSSNGIVACLMRSLLISVHMLQATRMNHTPSCSGDEKTIPLSIQRTKTSCTALQCLRSHISPGA